MRAERRRVLIPLYQWMLSPEITNVVNVDLRNLCKSVLSDESPQYEFFLQNVYRLKYVDHE